MAGVGVTQYGVDESGAACHRCFHPHRTASPHRGTRCQQAQLRTRLYPTFLIREIRESARSAS